MSYTYPFTNHIVFALVMNNSQICRDLLQLIFPDREIKEVKMHEDNVTVEQTVIAGIKAHYVRLDVLFKDSPDWYDIEMQVRDEHNLPKRTRYAHSTIDVSSLKSGDDYNKLHPVYVIFICCFDYFGQDKAIYRFSMREDVNHLPLGDETYTIILNTKASDKSAIPKALRELFQYINETVVTEGNKLIEQIDKSVAAWNTGEGRRMIMTLEQEIRIREKKAVHNLLINLVNDDAITIDQAAFYADMTVEEFQTLLDHQEEISDE